MTPPRACAAGRRVPWQNRHVGPCVIYGRELMGWEAAVSSALLYCLPHDGDATCADAAHRLALQAEKQRNGVLL